MSELSERVDATTRIAEALAVLAHRENAADFLVDGVRDSTGLDLGPTQAARTLFAYLCLHAAAGKRPLAVGDAEFIHRMTGSFLPNAATVGWAAQSLLEFRADSAEFEAQSAFLHEAYVLAKANRDDDLAQALGPDLTALLDAFAGPWDDAELNGRLTSSGPTPTEARAEQGVYEGYGGNYKPGSIRDRMDR